MKRINPYDSSGRREGDSSIDYRHDGNLPNVTLYKARIAYGETQYPYVKFSSGDAKSLGELREFIVFLGKLEEELAAYGGKPNPRRRSRR